MRKTHENVFPGDHCQKNIRLLSETFVRVSSDFATFFMDFNNSNNNNNNNSTTTTTNNNNNNNNNSNN